MWRKRTRWKKTTKQPIHHRAKILRARAKLRKKLLHGLCSLGSIVRFDNDWWKRGFELSARMIEREQ